MTSRPRRGPTPEALAAAVGRRVPDVLGDDLLVVFCGINPGLYSGAVGHHFARPGNRFWPALHGAGFTASQWSPEEDRRLPEVGLGITNLVARVTARADELSAEELRAGGKALRAKVARRRPAAVAVLGLGAFKAAFGTRARVGEQAEGLGATRLFVLPNPSGLQAHYQLPELVEAFSELREAVAPRAGER